MTIPLYLKRLLKPNVKRATGWENFAALLDTSKVLVTLVGGHGYLKSYGSHLLGRLRGRFGDRIEVVDILARQDDGLIECMDGGPAPDVRVFRDGRELGKLTGVWPEQEYVRVIEEIV